MPGSGEVKVIITDTSSSSVATSGGTSTPAVAPSSGAGSNKPKNPYKQTTNIKKLNDSVNKTNEKQGESINLGEIGAITYLVSTAKQAGSMALANVGRYTGSNQAQTEVNNWMQGIGLGVALYSHPVAALTSIAFTATQTIMEEEFRKRQESMQLSISRARAGYTDTKSILTSRRH